MIEMNINHIEKNYGFKNILDGLQLEINTGGKSCIHWTQWVWKIHSF